MKMVRFSLCLVALLAGAGITSVEAGRTPAEKAAHKAKMAARRAKTKAYLDREAERIKQEEAALEEAKARGVRTPTRTPKKRSPQKRAQSAVERVLFTDTSNVSPAEVSAAVHDAAEAQAAADKQREEQLRQQADLEARQQKAREEIRRKDLALRIANEAAQFVKQKEKKKARLAKKSATFDRRAEKKATAFLQKLGGQKYDERLNKRAQKINQALLILTAAALLATGQRAYSNRKLIAADKVSQEELDALNWFDNKLVRSSRWASDKAGRGYRWGKKQFGRGRDWLTSRSWWRNPFRRNRDAAAPAA